jgi:hypothetical protein
VSDLLCTPWRDQAQFFLGERSTWERKMNVEFFTRIVANITRELIIEERIDGDRRSDREGDHF